MLLKKIRILFCVLVIAIQMQIDGMGPSNSDPDVVDRVFSDPLLVSKQLQKIFSEREKLKNVTQEQANPIVQEWYRQCPVWLLSECDSPKACCFSRSYDSNIRKAFEDKVTGYLLDVLSLAKTNMDMSKRLVTYTSFGSGLAYQDFVIMVKTLKQCPDAQLDINLIDIDNATYIKAAKALKYTRKIKIDGSLDINTYIASQPVLTVTEQNRLRTYFDIRDTRYKQFIITLINKFPEAQLCLRIHETVDSYLHYTRTQELPYADVVSAADIQDSASNKLGASDQYKQLCATTLQKNCTASNVWLMRSGVPHSIVLGSITLESTPNSTEEIIKLTDRTGTKLVPVHVTRELLYK